EEDRQATVSLQRELADNKYKEIWEIVEQGLQELREQAFYQKQCPEARQKLESHVVIYILERAEGNVRKEVTGELPFESYPDRKNDGKWFAMGEHYEAGYDYQKSEREYRRYWTDGEASNSMGEYDGYKDVRMCAYDCLLGHTYIACGSRNITGDTMLRMLYMVACDREKELALLNSRILEQVDVLLELGLLARREGGKIECLVPVITRENRDYMHKIGDEYGDLIGQKFHDELLSLVKHPVKLPPHLKSVAEWYRYHHCENCLTMMLAERAREAGLFLAGYDGPAPAIYLVVEK
ncbi:MAG: hypothetical protein K2H45_15560, partial [Acetatifactor sp.]|nr:hypothetical protein [Acetatifactor sp.]